jgi:transposase
VKHATAATPDIATHMSVELPTSMGLDLSDRISCFHVLRGDGHTLGEGKVAMRAGPLAELFGRFRGCRLVIEAGTHSPWVSRLGNECGMQVFVVNPRRFEEIAKNERKTDRGDAQILAEVGRTNVGRARPITHRSQQAQIDLSRQRARCELVRSRTALINHVRGVLKSHGHRAPGCSSVCFPLRVNAVLPDELRPVLGPLVQLLLDLNAGIKQYDQQLQAIPRTQVIAKRLQAIPGIGPIAAVTFALTLDDPTRFKKSRQLGAYLGVVPRKKESGDYSPQLHVTKSGDREMRRLLVLAANYILGRFGPDCDLRRFGQKIAGNGGNKAAKKRALVAVARKLAVLMHHLWVTGQDYDPFHLAKKRGEAVPA